MKDEWKTVLKAMKAEGYAVIVWTPEELGDIDPDWVEDASISYGNEYLIDYEDAPRKVEEGTYTQAPTDAETGPTGSP